MRTWRMPTVRGVGGGTRFLNPGNEVITDDIPGIRAAA